MATTPESLLTGSDFQAFVADVANAVQDYCADGFDALESCLTSAPGLSNDLKMKISRGIQPLYVELLQQVQQSMTNFETVCLQTAFKVPAQALLPAVPQALQTSDLISAEEEAQLDGELEQLAARVAAVRQECATLRLEAAALDRETSSFNAAMSRYAGLTATAATNKENVIDDVAAVMEAMTKLQPLLAQAQAQRESRQPLAGGSRSHSDALAAASWRASQYAAQTGAGVSEIRELKQMLS